MRINRKPLVLSNKELREIQLVELEILLEVDRICRIHDIKYFLGYGTMLGAIRHQGFIPWDDDVDVLMPRNEYDKFCEVCKTELDTKRFFWQTWHTDPNYRIGYGKMRRKGTKYVRTGQERMKYKQRISIDIMPLDNVPFEKKKRKELMKKCNILKKIMYSKAGSMCEKNPLLRIGYKLLSFLPKEKVIPYFEKTVLECKDKDSISVRCLFAIGTTTYYRGLFDERIEVKFEGYDFYTCKNYDMFLKTCYGPSYMEFPPEEERHGHASVSEVKVLKPQLGKQIKYDTL